MILFRLAIPESFNKSIGRPEIGTTGEKKKE